MDSDAPPSQPIAFGWGPRWLRRLVAAVGVAYLLVLALSNSWLDVSRWLPGVPRFFIQVSCLFPDAARATIEYRVAGWSCSDRRWVEIDTRPDFPMRSEDKENRFYRVAHFYHSNRAVMQALDAFLVERHNARAAWAGEKIGGVQLLSLRIPLPHPGDQVEQYRWRPLSEYPEEYRKEWYRTGRARVRERCGEGP